MTDDKSEMKDYYKKHDRLYVGVDCIVFGLNEGSLKLLLIKRDFEPLKGEWSLMGGFVNINESVEDAARRILKDLTGLESVYMRQVGTFGEVNRDPGERVVSVAYTALLNFPDIDHSTLEAHNASWVDIDKLPKLGFDHSQMVEKAISKIRMRFKTEPLAFQLLPELFTLSKLQQLYETVLDQKIDKRNFRRRVYDNSCIIATDVIDKSGSRRGAQMYRYNPDDKIGIKNFKM